MGVSISSTMLARMIQVNHAEMVVHINPFNRLLNVLVPRALMSDQAPQTAAVLDAEINRQAAMIAYIDVYRLVAFGLAGMAIFLPLMRPMRKAAAAAAQAAPVEV
jgi:DHA2 family multidrug resistance protein